MYYFNYTWPLLLFFSSPKASFQILLLSLWDHFGYHLCSELFCSSWVWSHLLLNPLIHGLYFSSGIIPFLFHFLSLSSPSYHFPAVKNFFGAVTVKQMLKYRYEIFFPYREILFENRIAVFRLLLSPCCPCAYWCMERNR